MRLRCPDGGSFPLELTTTDVWVWDVYRSDRVVKSVRVLTFTDVDVEERSAKEFELPQELAIDEQGVTVLPPQTPRRREAHGVVTRGDPRVPGGASSSRRCP